MLMVVLLFILAACIAAILFMLFHTILMIYTVLDEPH